MTMQAETMQSQAENEDTLQCATFYLGEGLFGVPIQEVDEINRHLDLTPVPHAPDYVRGVINLRGEVVTVIDLRVVLGLTPATIAPTTRNVVVSAGGERVGLLVDRIADVVAAANAEIGPPPANVHGADGKFFRGVFKLENELMIVLDVPSVLQAGAAA
jgi:purine-binding chemotaxis protein CheW